MTDLRRIVVIIDTPANVEIVTTIIEALAYRHRNTPLSLGKMNVVNVYEMPDYHKQGMGQ